MLSRQRSPTNAALGILRNALGDAELLHSRWETECRVILCSYHSLRVGFVVSGWKQCDHLKPSISNGRCKCVCSHINYKDQIHWAISYRNQCICTVFAVAFCKFQNFAGSIIGWVWYRRLMCVCRAFAVAVCQFESFPGLITGLG